MIHNIFLFIIFEIFHPFHVSVSDIKYNQTTKNLQISSRIFLDDLEKALTHHANFQSSDITNPNQWSKVNNALKNYVLDNISISNKNNPLILNYIGAEIEKDVMWIYLESERVNTLKNIGIKNTLLLESFDDQENIIHIKYYDKLKSIRLNKEKTNVNIPFKKER